MTVAPTRLPGQPVFLVDGARSPFLKARNKPGPLRASDLAVQAGRALLDRQPFAPDRLDEVVLGCTMPGPDEANIARVCALRMGCGDGVPGYTVMRNCGSGMQALDSAALAISSGRVDLVLAGGADAMSHAPVLFSEKFVAVLGEWSAAKTWPARLAVLKRFRLGYLRPVIALLRGLTDPVVGLNMGQTAEELSTRFSVTREQADGFAVRSHERLAAAVDGGRLEEVVPVFDYRGKAYHLDDGLRRDSSTVRLAKLKPVFDREFGRVTAGNSAQVTDGACWLLLASEKAVNEYQLPVLARLVDVQWSSLDPRVMGLGPVHASVPLLQRHGFTLDDMSRVEINEAFAAQVLACVRALAEPEFCREHFHVEDAVGTVDESRLNVDGGGISLGHPVGVSGARIILHLAHSLAEAQGRFGLASLCIGGGQGGAMLLERTG